MPVEVTCLLNPGLILIKFKAIKALYPITIGSKIALKLNYLVEGSLIPLKNITIVNLSSLSKEVAP